MAARSGAHFEGWRQLWMAKTEAVAPARGVGTPPGQGAAPIGWDVSGGDWRRVSSVSSTCREPAMVAGVTRAAESGPALRCPVEGVATDAAVRLLRAAGVSRLL